MTVYHKSLLFVNKNVSLRTTPVMSQIASLLETNFIDQLDVNFDYFISKQFQMFEFSLRGIFFLGCLVPELKGS